MGYGFQWQGLGEALQGMPRDYTLLDENKRQNLNQGMLRDRELINRARTGTLSGEEKAQFQQAHPDAFDEYGMLREHYGMTQEEIDKEMDTERERLGAEAQYYQKGARLQPDFLKRAQKYQFDTSPFADSMGFVQRPYRTAAEEADFELRRKQADAQIAAYSRYDDQSRIQENRYQAQARSQAARDLQDYVQGLQTVYNREIAESPGNAGRRQARTNLERGLGSLVEAYTKIYAEAFSIPEDQARTVVQGLVGLGSSPGTGPTKYQFNFAGTPEVPR